MITHYLRRLARVSLVLIIIGGGYYAWRYELPDRHNPLAPLTIDQPHGLATGLKMARLRDNPEQCFDVLQRSNLAYDRVADRRTGKGCGFFHAARLQQSGVSYGGGIALQCATLVSLARWQRHALEPLAKAIFHQPLARVRHYGTYACRNINGSESARRSEHATANAIDVAGFVLADGTAIDIATDWGSDGPAGRYLTAIHERACRAFRTVLGPAYNAAHHDHFHLANGRYRACR